MDAARFGRHLAGDRTQQRGLARAVRAHQRDVLAVPGAERDVAEQHLAAGYAHVIPFTSMAPTDAAP